MIVNNTPVYLDHIVLHSDAPDTLAKFYGDVLQMHTKKIPGGWFCQGRERKLVIAQKTPDSVLTYTFYCCSKDALIKLKHTIEISGGKVQPATSPLNTGDLDFSIQDPSGNHLCFSYADSTGMEGFEQSLKGRLQHLAIASTCINETLAFYRNIIGFEASDRVEDEAGNLAAVFLRGSSEHHCLAIFSASSNRLDHFAFEAEAWDLIKDWADHLSEHDIKLSWGPGRHGPGHNLFLMFNDPDGHWLEVSAELEMFDQKQPRPVATWEACEKTLNLWGKGLLRQ